MRTDQYVIACLEYGRNADAVVAAARQMAERLNHKGLMLLCVCNAEQKQEATQWLSSYALPHAVVPGSWREVLAVLPTHFGGILAVTEVDATASRKSIAHPSTLLRTFADCKIAYLCIPSPLASTQEMKTVVSLDYRRESKEKLIWASYLNRFCGCNLTVALPDYRDEALRQKLHNNVQFMQRMYDGLEMKYQRCRVPWKLSQSADMAAYKHLTPDLMVAMTTDVRDRDLLDHIVGAPEVRLLRQAAKAKSPLLMLNQRDDLYVLCD